MSDVASSNFLENIVDIVKITLTNSFYPLDAVDKFYTMYLTSIPFIVIGFFCSVKHFLLSLKTRCFHYSFLYLLFFVSGLITIGLTGTNYVYRANYFFISYLYFLVSGIYATYHFLRSYHHLFIGALSACYLLWSLAFFRYYFSIYSMADMYTYPHSLYFIPATEAVSFAQEELEVENIYIDCVTMDTFHYFFFPVSPYEKVALEHSDRNGYGRYYCEINYYTPIDTENAYIVRKENRDFFNNLSASGLDYLSIEYPYYYLIYFE